VKPGNSVSVPLDTVLTHVRALALLYVDEPPAMATATVARSVMEAAGTWG
jgi:hypothetical protein